MKTRIKIVLLLLIPAFSMAQQSTIDSLRKALRSARTDSARHFSLIQLAWYELEINRDTSLYYFEAALPVAIKNNKVIDEAFILDIKGYLLMRLGKYPESLQCLQQALKLAEDPENESKTWNLNYAGVYAGATDMSAGWLKKFTPHKTRLDIIANIYNDIGNLMGSTNNIDQQINQYKQAGLLAGEVKDYSLLALANASIGKAYLSLNRLDSALIFEQNAELIFKRTGLKTYASFGYETMGNIYLKKGNHDLAFQYFHKAINVNVELKNNYKEFYRCYAILTSYYLSEKQKDSSLYYAAKALATLKSMGSNNLDEAYENLYKSFRLRGNTDSAYKYQGLALIAKDSIYQATTRSLADFQKLSFKAQIQAQDLEKEKAATQTRIRTYSMLAAIGVLMLLAGIFYRNNRQKQKVNNLLYHQKEEIVQQKEEIESQRDNLEKMLSNLKAAQTQLIQSEKMASLGELTAGIAHEIQNPLNFVNNFSEVNQEMMDELEAELTSGNISEALTIATDIKQNEQKINHHGKRADAIVKGMLEHSRAGAGQKEPTNINNLADEYLRLAYHGLRSKDKDFNAELVTHFDEKLPKVNAVPQDIGRVLLNLFNNAFYAVNLKKKTAGADYKPEVSVTTYTDNGQVVIKVKDNGIGIPDNIKEKIMQPFFTTKPTGEGTGLGLSLTYDMVVNGHGGKLEVESKEGEYTQFTVLLPSN